MDVYDTEKVGKCIAWSGDHFVYEYDADSVIKFSKIEFVLGHVGREKALRDYEVCKRYFGENVLPTEFLRFPTAPHMAKRQKKISGHSLTSADLKDGGVRTELQKIATAYHRMVSEGVAPLDLIGGHGIIFERLSNIFVTDDKKLYLIDTTLIEFEVRFLRPLVRLVCRHAVRRQNRLLREFLK